MATQDTPRGIGATLEAFEDRSPFWRLCCGRCREADGCCSTASSRCSLPS